MNLSAPALLGTELFLLLAFLALAWGMLSWRKRRQQTRSLEEMVDLPERNTAERGLHYSQWLKSHPSLSNEEAQAVADQWLEAEKQFWQVFVAWPLHPDPKTRLTSPINYSGFSTATWKAWANFFLQRKKLRHHNRNPKDKDRRSNRTCESFRFPGESSQDPGSPKGHDEM